MPMEFSQRDKSAGIESEAFWVSFNTFDDNLNYQSFEVTPAGAISDMFSSGDFDPQSDYDYDTVFEGYSSIDKDGWYVEMRIPYSALRFPKKNIQEWGINFGRHSPELDSYFIWNYADPKNSKYQQSFGLMKGLKDITPPARLFFYPYFQISQDFKKGYSSQNSYSAGLDLKYGLGNSFTLDATLIPDFGQVTFDDQALNLSPFEQQFDENRPFFMEGASLFEKADGMGYRSGRFFYSRRIGEEISFNEITRLLVENQGYIKTSSGYVKVSEESQQELKTLNSFQAFTSKQSFNMIEFLPLLGISNITGSDSNSSQFIENFKNFHRAEDTLSNDFQGELRDYQTYGVKWLSFLNQYQFGGVFHQK